MKELFKAYENSIDRFEEILKDQKNIKNRDSAIKRFEFTIELSWKVIQKFLREQEIICRSPKECLKEVFKFGLIEDDSVWIEALEDRNLTVHTYDEMTADDVYGRLSKYQSIFRKLQESLKDKIE